MNVGMRNAVKKLLSQKRIGGMATPGLGGYRDHVHIWKRTGGGKQICKRCSMTQHRIAGMWL
jgi:hypothetical protein